MLFFKKVSNAIVGYATGKEKELEEEKVLEKAAEKFQIDKNCVEVIMKTDFTELQPQEYVWIINHPSDEIHLMLPPETKDGYTLDVKFEPDGYVSPELTVFTIIMGKEQNKINLNNEDLNEIKEKLDSMEESMYNRSFGFDDENGLFKCKDLLFFNMCVHKALGITYESEFQYLLPFMYEG